MLVLPIPRNSLWIAIKGKLYNKCVCQIVCASVQENLGNTVANYSKCHDKRLAESFTHPDVQACGICRDELSLYGIRPEEARLETAEKAVSYVYYLSAGNPLFWAYPLCEQCKAPASAIHRNIVFLSNQTNKLYAVYWGHTTNGRICGCPRTTRIGNSRFDKRTIFRYEYPPSGSWV